MAEGKMLVLFKTPQNDTVAINGREVRFMVEQTHNRTAVYFAKDHVIQINCGLQDAAEQLWPKPVSSRARK